MPERSPVALAELLVLEAFAMMQRRSLAEVAAEVERVRAHLTAPDFTAAAGEALRTELRELVVACREALSREGLLFRFNGFLRMADRECLRHCDRLCADDRHGAWVALMKASDYLERCLCHAAAAQAGASDRSAVARSA